MDAVDLPVIRRGMGWAFDWKASGLSDATVSHPVADKSSTGA
jgi:hypothetical protein